MNRIVLRLVVSVSIILFILYSMLYISGSILYDNTVITSEEVTIERFRYDLTHIKYVVNQNTGDEYLFFSPVGLAPTYVIQYNGSCQCIETVHKVGEYYVSRHLHGTEQLFTYYSTGKTVSKLLPAGAMKEKFDEGMKLRKKIRKRYADILSQ